MKAIKIQEMQALPWAEIVQNQILRYKGDAAPHASAFLYNKGKVTQSWLLPGFTTKEDGSREWFDTPGARDDEYRVVAVEKNRTRKKKDGTPGSALPDLYLIQGAGYSNHIFFGLTREDVIAKFDLIRTPTAFDDLTKTAEEKAVEVVHASEWERNLQESAW